MSTNVAPTAERHASRREALVPSAQHRLSEWNGCDLLVEPPPEVFAARFSTRPLVRPLLPRIHRIGVATSTTTLRGVAAAAATSLCHTIVKPSSSSSNTCGGGVVAPQAALLHNPLPFVHVLPSVVASLRNVLATLRLAPNGVGEVMLLSGCHPSLVDVVTNEFQLKVTWASLRLCNSILVSCRERSCAGVGTATVDVASLRQLITPTTGLIFLAGHVVLDCGVPWASYVNGGNWWQALGTLQEETSIPCVVELSDLGEALAAIMVRGPPTEGMLATQAAAGAAGANAVVRVLRDRTNPLARVPMLLLNASHNDGAVVVLAPALLGSTMATPWSRVVVRELSALWARLWALFVDDPLSTGLIFGFFAALHAIGVPTMLRRSAGSASLPLAFLRHLSAQAANHHKRSLSSTAMKRNMAKLDATLVVQGAAVMNSNHHRDSPIAKLRMRWMACAWQFVQRLPPYVEVLSASDPRSPQKATFCSHGVVLLVRVPSVVIATLQRSGFDARTVCAAAATAAEPNSGKVARSNGSGRRGADQSTRERTALVGGLQARNNNAVPLLFDKHAVRIAVGPDMAPSALRRLLLVVWGIQASDVASPFFDPNPPPPQTQDADVGGTKSKKKKKGIGARPCVYDTPEVRAFCSGHALDAICHEPFSPLLVATLGVAGVALSKL